MQYIDYIDTVFVHIGVYGRKWIIAWIIIAMLINTVFLRYTENDKYKFGLIPGLSTVFYRDLYVNTALCVISTLLSVLVFFAPALIYLLPFYIVTSLRNKTFVESAMPEHNAIIGGWVPFARYLFELSDICTLLKENAEEEDELVEG